MGKVMVSAKFTNMGDVFDYKRKMKSIEDVRCLTLDALIDTGAVMVSLPEKIVDKLGLSVDEGKMIKITLANGEKESRKVAEILEIEILGRSWIGKCIVDPKTDFIIIGQIPLEEMDLHINMQKQTLEPDPSSPDVPNLMMI